jgi:HlyD family secretion protein
MTPERQVAERSGPRPDEGPSEIAPLRQPARATAVDPPARSRHRLLGIVILGAVIVAVLVWRGFFATPGPDNVLTLSGRIEGDGSAVAPKAAGRLLDVRVREGDSVRAGDVIAVLDDDQVRAREDQARAALAHSEARAKVAEVQIAVLQEQERQARLQTEQSKIDAAGRVQQAEADLATAQAQLAQQQAAHQIAMFDRDAYVRLAEAGAASERQSKQAISTADQQAAAVNAARKRVDAAEGALATARANLSNPEIRAAGTAMVQRQIAQQSAEIASVAAQIEQARAALAEAQANRQDLTVRAPFAGTVVTRSAEPGEVVMAGTPVVVLVDLGKVYLRGFVPEGQIGRVKIDQAARIYLDSNPNEPVDASVARIDPQATFTPENTYFREDRVKQVVGVKLQIKGAVGFAKPGMPADGEILVSGTWPKAGRRAS